MLNRECLARGLSTADSGLDVNTLASVQEWHNMDERSKLSVMLLSIGNKLTTDSIVSDEIRHVAHELSVPVVVLAESEELGTVLHAFNCGARGYIPSSATIQTCVMAIKCVMSGGIFIPGNIMGSMTKMYNNGNNTNHDEAANGGGSMFTVRQLQVIKALRQGKANKIIAYDLNMCESTVKVHIRNIMKKLEATNRTEIAFKINNLMASGRLRLSDPPNVLPFKDILPSIAAE